MNNNNNKSGAQNKINENNKIMFKIKNEDKSKKK